MYNNGVKTVEAQIYLRCMFKPIKEEKN